VDNLCQLDAAAAGAAVVELEPFDEDEPFDELEPFDEDEPLDEDEVVDSELLAEPLLELVAALLAGSRLSVR
jgi:hypothetical protein